MKVDLGDIKSWDLNVNTPTCQIVDEPDDDDRHLYRAEIEGVAMSWGSIMHATGGSLLRTPSRTDRGGEFDGYRHLPKRVKLQLAGGRYTSRRGVHPDRLALIVAEQTGIEMDCDRLIEWYVAAALVQIESNRRLRQVRAWARVREVVARSRRAQRAGCRTFFGYRDAMARKAGFSSFYAMRKARGWSVRSSSGTVPMSERKAA